MAGFALANVVAACATNYATLMFARALLALLAGLYVQRLGGGHCPARTQGKSFGDRHRRDFRGRRIGCAD
jgi:hypothetical protein